VKTKEHNKIHIRKIPFLKLNINKNNKKNQYNKRKNIMKEYTMIQRTIPNWKEQIDNKVKIRQYRKKHTERIIKKIKLLLKINKKIKRTTD